ncbi:MAG: hypothetical protein HWE26_11625 [Alteromonadaceae bacterium]|nr:hypothetical protein [Alteromonadaceae bacterium]
MSKRRLNHYMRLLLVSSVLYGAKASCGVLIQNQFWQVSTGYWASQNTYIDGAYQPKIPHYQTLTSIHIDGDTVISEERKFYPAGKFAASALGLTIPADLGVELIQISRGLADASGRRVDFKPINAYSHNQHTWLETISADTAVLTVTERKTGHSSYKMLLTLPNDNARITANLGLNSKYSADSNELPLRGVSLFSATRINATQFQQRTKQLQQDYNVGAIITIDAQGKYQATLLHQANR